MGKIYYFSPQDLEIKAGEHVIVETARGVEYGKCCADLPREASEKVVQALKEVIHVGAPQDDKKEERTEKEKRGISDLFKEIRAA